MTFEELMSSTPPMQQHALVKGYQAGFAAGAASRDAEIAELVKAIEAFKNDPSAPYQVLYETLEKCRDYMELPAQRRTVQPYSEVCEALAKVRKS